MGTASVRPDRELSVSDVPLTIGGCLAAVAVAEAGTSTPSPIRMWSVVPPVAEAGTSTPSPFRMESVVSPVAEAGASTPSPFRMGPVVSPVAETIVAVPLVVVPVHVTVIVPVLKSITPILTMPVLIAFVRFAGATSHSGAVHREAIHPSAVAGRYAATMEAATAARQRTRTSQQRFG
jgi:hypothetical protein